MVGKTTWVAAAALLSALAPRPSEGATLEPHADVTGEEIASAEVRAGKGGAWRATAWDDLGETPLHPGAYEIRVAPAARGEGEALWLPVCAGRGRVALDGRVVAAPPGPLVIPLSPGPHEVIVAVTVSDYEARIACGGRPRVGAAGTSIEGLGLIAYSSPMASRGGGRAVVYVPAGHDHHRPSPVLVGAHPWNGSIWTYAAYAELLRDAQARDVVLLMPSGLGNSLYTADAEDEVLRALDAVREIVAVDPRAVTIWGASMGGAGATTVAFHHPDRFASVVSFFGDSKYDLRTYVRAILPDEAAAHLVNALDVVDNARYLPVLLIHGEDDRTSPLRQSEILERAMRERGFTVRFERVARYGHSGALVARFLSQVVALAVTARTPASPSRVTYRSTRPTEAGAYGVRIVRAALSGDAFVDVEKDGDAVHVRRAEGLRAISLARGALGTSAGNPPVIVDDTHSIEAQWAGTP
jgi:pimeloyl-ACP methyl ester carboxylesterase